MRIQQGENVATFADGKYTSENASFAYWLSTAFPDPTAEALLACGLDVDGVQGAREPEPTIAADALAPTPGFELPIPGDRVLIDGVEHIVE